MSGTVLYDIRGDVAVITLNRPEARNAVDAGMAGALRDAVARLEADADARVGILAAAGAVFCAGMDLRAFLDGDGDAILFGPDRFAGFVAAERTKPVIAAVHGPALAGGFEIALACDLIVAGQRAVFGLPETGVGIFACAGGPFRLARRIPPARATELALTGDRMDAAEAHALGLVSILVPEGEELATAEVLASRILRNAPLGVAATLALIRAAEAQREEELWALNDTLWKQIANSADAAEGPRAFAEKRRPVWRGR